MGCFSYRICLYTENQMCSKLDVNWVCFFFFFFFFPFFFQGEGEGGGTGNGAVNFEPCVVTRDFQTPWQFIIFLLQMFFFPCFCLVLCLFCHFVSFSLPFFPFKQPNCVRGFWELAVNRSLRKAKLVLVFNCSVFLCFNRSLKTCLRKKKKKKKMLKATVYKD